MGRPLCFVILGGDECDPIRVAFQNKGWVEQQSRTGGGCTVGAEVIWASTRGLLDKSFSKGDLTPATMVNHFLRGFVLGTKIPLLRSLRTFYEEGGVPPHPDGPRTLDELLPRSYDLRELHELETFLDDLACSQAEAIFQIASKSPVAANVAQVKAAVDVLSSLASTGALPCCHAVSGRAAPLFQAEGP
eukprot:CAMPEP_0204342856 /NCGR_PEP_ID=MMETSP0469-20131031/24460_1 /ASSEMBLY_ACC=CAM_ASM_000384 /TAXON_ID=2969 /ORGANISM="Oxyrrhis marina" /LENGTH=188 /DNA_ID=CAMNT_0051327849 /DNA_START=20 /DNA_END=582 /DNA_ORIENTATION=-